MPQSHVADKALDISIEQQDHGSGFFELPKPPEDEAMTDFRAPLRVASLIKIFALKLAAHVQPKHKEDGSTVWVSEPYFWLEFQPNL